ncbi:MAG: hypothetical protein PVG78_03010 [Desulfobacterales bacterium]|jgi:hypothetical protein
MTHSTQGPISAKQLSHRLLNIAVNQRETKADISGVQSKAAVNWVAVEYEMQMMRIVAVGWAISYFSSEAAAPENLSETFWEGVGVYCAAVSSMTAPVLGSGSDYFGTVRQRLDHYVQVMAHFPDVADPARVIGPTFAKLCGCGENADVISLGRRVFSRCLARVQEQLLSC